MSNYNTSPEFEEKVRKAVSVPNARPEFVNRLRYELADRPVRRKTGITLKPAWAIAFVLMLAMLIASAPQVATAIKQLVGYVRGVGLVENIADMRVLSEPVSETRDGITLTLEELMAYQDHVELSYSVGGLPTVSRFNPDNDLGKEDSFCFGEDSYPSLLLPDGTSIMPDPMGLGGKWLADQSGYYAGHSFSAPIPENMDGATFVLRCLSEMKRGEAPEEWLVSFNLVPAPENTAVGSPVMDGEPSDMTKSTDQGITLTFDRVVKEEDGYVIYVTMGWDETSNSRLSTVPMSFSVTDSTGQKIPVSPIDHPGRPWNDEERQFVYKMASIPADGPLTVEVDKVWTFYIMDKTKDMMEQPSFTFAAGADPQIGQMWTINQHFQFGNLPFDIPSARMVDQDGYKGYEFLVQTAQPSSMLLLNIADFNTPNFWSEYPSEHGTMLLYDGDVPQSMEVLVYKIGVVLEGNWRVTWTPPTR